MQNVCKKGKFLLKETILSNAKENKQKSFMDIFGEKIHPSSVDGTIKVAEPSCVHYDNFFVILQVFEVFCLKQSC